MRGPGPGPGAGIYAYACMMNLPVLGAEAIVTVDSAHQEPPSRLAVPQSALLVLTSFDPLSFHLLLTSLPSIPYRTV